MKTLSHLIEVRNLNLKNNNTTATTTDGTFVLKNDRVTFQIVFTPAHIQMLRLNGLSIDLKCCKMHPLSESAKRFKSGREAIAQGEYAPYYYMGDPNNAQTGVIKNELITTASCSSSRLEFLLKISRFNHADIVNIDNDYQLAKIGIARKTKYASAVSIDTQYVDIKAIRRTCQGKKASDLLPIQKRVLGMY